MYEAVSEAKSKGMQHWLPLFHDKLETIFDYLPGTPLALEHLKPLAAHAINDYYETRRKRSPTA